RRRRRRAAGRRAACCPQRASSRPSAPASAPETGSPCGRRARRGRAASPIRVRSSCRSSSVPSGADVRMSGVPAYPGRVTDPTKPTLLIVDGHSLAFRAFFALPVDSFQNSEGQHTNGIHGFLGMFLNLLKNEAPTHVAVAFDVSDKTFRKDEYPDYKEGRDVTPPEFKGQIPLLKQALEAMNITVLEKEGFEADDILATLARRGTEAG